MAQLHFALGAGLCQKRPEMTGARHHQRYPERFGAGLLELQHVAC